MQICTKRPMARAMTIIAGLACVSGPFAAPASAGGLTVRVVDSAGQPVPDAIVTLRPANAVAPRPHAESGLRVIQHDTRFSPFISIVPVGSTVAFPNLDPFRHHVYSFSAAKRFELKLVVRDQSRKVTFDKPGVVAIGCNIHDTMSAYIFVTDTVWTARASSNGAATFRDTPAGSFTAQVWHPHQRAPGGTVAHKLTASTGGLRETFTIKLRRPPVHGTGGY